MAFLINMLWMKTVSWYALWLLIESKVFEWLLNCFICLKIIIKKIRKYSGKITKNVMLYPKYAEIELQEWHSG